MIKFTVRAPLIKTAMLFQANRDIRYYLNGIRIESKRIVSTNGHCLWMHNFDTALDITEPFIIQFKGLIPAKAYHVNFEVSEKSGVAYSEDVDGKIIAATYFELINGKYQDIDIVINPKQDEQITPEIGFDTKYLSLMAKAAKLVGNTSCPKVAANLRGADAVSIFNIVGPEFKSKLLLMPVRL